MRRRCLLLELFSGTHSVGNVARELGWKVVSVDIAGRATIHADVLKLNYKTLETPDMIWASPPCTTYSIAATWYKHRDPQTATPFTEQAKHADQILRRTMQIIRYFNKLNPALCFCVENPRGYMRRSPIMRDIHRVTTLYSNYGFPIAKPTDFFCNFDLKLHPPRIDSPSGITVGRGKGWREKLRNATGHSRSQAELLGVIPPSLVKTILLQASCKINHFHHCLKM